MILKSRYIRFTDYRKGYEKIVNVRVKCGASSAARIGSVRPILRSVVQSCRWNYQQSTANIICCNRFNWQQQQQQPFILTRLFSPVYWGQPRLWPSHNIFLHLDLSQAFPTKSLLSHIFSQHFSPSLPGLTFHSITIYLQCLNSIGRFNWHPIDIQ